MPAVVNYGPEPHSVELREVPIPEIGDTDVLLAVQAVGVCGTDTGAYLGKFPLFIYPRIPGHELGVEVLEVGRLVRVDEDEVERPGLLGDELR